MRFPWNTVHIKDRITEPCWRCGLDRLWYTGESRHNSLGTQYVCECGNCLERGPVGDEMTLHPEIRAKREREALEEFLRLLSCHPDLAAKLQAVKGESP